ncbi:very short patch repair endonuclease [Rhodovulum sulfidophilum]|uniref:very short patch repair endonuclease n=1 Tax=Rhodovulum sulfidophilum TaxID=35806 RepID=UPI001F31495A|nr:very short patch repair endonuclease [Rhodovulum sulfidophilum]MCE8438357.1 very short patch repair endonuclease [Rhodovulum sulfidophilum]MCE8468033.1 very short patch repair endonuclease [Rhodovulum sulfidophilum]
MADIVPPEVRSRMMASIGRRDTKPEVMVRKALHAAGFRFRLDVRDMPGSPDIVLPKWRTAIFVHGCFWHRHPGCARATTPATRPEFWQRKFDANTARDARVEAALVERGWKVGIIWECALENGTSEQSLLALIEFIRREYDAACRVEIPKAPVLLPMTR